jgi:hypothetical protein
MYIHSLLCRLLRPLVPIAFCLTVYLYFYPVFHGCAFPSTDGSIATAFHETIRQHGWLKGANPADIPPSLAPFRLLVLADPQLEGDSSLPKPEDGLLPRLSRHWQDVRNATIPEFRSTAKARLKAIYSRDIPDAFYALRKRLDLIGNDYYLAHIYRTLHWWAKPTHVTVLGDLIGSQWVTDEEFEWRGWRYWNRVFVGGRKAEEDLLPMTTENLHQLVWTSDGNWTRRIINIAGNHDIGYAGDISKARLERFERIFGKANWDVRFEYPATANVPDVTPTLHLIVLNTLNLDTPVLDEELQHESYNFINSVITRSKPVEDRTSFTLLLTHVPLHKDAGICVDAPYFDFWGDDDGGGVYKPHGVKEQNHLSDHGSRRGILEGLFGMSGALNAAAGGRGRNGLILNGHDHEGCDVWHYIANASDSSSETAVEGVETKWAWESAKWQDAPPRLSQTGIREVTLRSMMGEFDGNAGLLSAWFDFGKGEWQYDIQMCKAGVQHIWWAIHILDIVTVAMFLLQAALLFAASPNRNAPLPKVLAKPALAAEKK